MKLLLIGTTMSAANFMSGTTLKLPKVFISSGNKPNIKSRAYARFKTIDALGAFHKAFNGHIFTDSKGTISLDPF